MFCPLQLSLLTVKGIMQLSYNTQQEKITLTEYGRGVQEMVEHLKLEQDREKRTYHVSKIEKS